MIGLGEPEAPKDTERFTWRGITLLWKREQYPHFAGSQVNSSAYAKVSPAGLAWRATIRLSGGECPAQEAATPQLALEAALQWWHRALGKLGELQPLEASAPSTSPRTLSVEQRIKTMVARWVTKAGRAPRVVKVASEEYRGLVDDMAALGLLEVGEEPMHMLLATAGGHVKVFPDSELERGELLVVGRVEL